jgi:hypothetical protein
MAISKFPLPTPKTDEFTSSGTWVCPTNVFSAEFLVVGAGGAGGGCGASGTRYAAGGGGGGGSVKKQILKVTPGSSYTVTIGAAGAGVAALAGGTGGFTEVLLSGTTLIRSLGGGGGCGVTTGNAESRTARADIAGGGGRAGLSSNDSCCGGGGGGANLGLNGLTISLFDSDPANASSKGNEGTNGKLGDNAQSDQWGTTVGMPGINGFGQGGNGSSVKSTSGATANSAFGAGTGIVRTTTGQVAGNAATIAGCGGGGAVLFATTTSVAGGNGFAGLVRISYVG